MSVSLGTNTSSVISPFINVLISNGSTELSTTALLDGGSEATLITQHLADVLSLNSKASNVWLRTFHGEDPAVPTRQVSFILSSSDGSQVFRIRVAYIVDSLHIAQRTIDWPKLKKQWIHLSDLPLNGFDSSAVGILVGANVPGALRQLEMRLPSTETDPAAVLTPFGWTVMGPLSSLPLANQQDKSILQTSALHSLFQAPPTWMKHEFETSRDRREFHLAEETDARNILASSIKLVNGHYILPLLWKSAQPNLPDNRSSALHCLFVSEARCRKDPIYSERISRGMEMYLNSGFARQLSPNELTGPPGRTWYLPYFIVLHPRTHKPRLVFHASKQFQKRCLNEELHLKPDLITPLQSVLTRFRELPFAVSMDVVKMFLQVGVPECDQDALRFIYRRPGSSGPPITYRMTVQIFGAASSMTACVYALQQTARDNPEYNDVADKLSDCFYVDNYLDSYATEEEAVYGCTSLVELLRKGGFELSQLISSSRNVLKLVPTESNTTNTINLDFDKLPEDSTLGLRWNGHKDCFIFSLTAIPTPSTKREMLSSIGKIFDPLGFLTCVIMPARMLVQEVWKIENENHKDKRKQNWDRKLPPEIIKRWEKITKSWKQLVALEIPRCLKPNSDEDGFLQIHIFCDASKGAKGAVAYLRSESSKGITVTFIAAKSKVTKLTDRDTIPQAELKAARLGAWLDTKIRRALRLKIQQSIFWVDSAAVLYWIRAPSHKRNPRYVAAHRTAILESSSPTQWRYVPTHLNVADDITRGIKAKAMSADHRFIRGADFIHLAEANWPTQPSELSLLNDVVCEFLNNN